MNTTRGKPLVVHNSNYVVNHIDRPTRDIWICSLKSSHQNPTPRSPCHLGLLSNSPFIPTRWRSGCHLARLQNLSFFLFSLGTRPAVNESCSHSLTFDLDRR